MSRSFLTNINLNNNSLINAVISNAAPTVVAGSLWYSGSRLQLGTGSGTSVSLATTADTVTIGSTAVTVAGSAVTTFAGLSSVTSTTFVGALTGNASTATTLATARNINGVSFNGSGNITITAANPNALTIGSGLTGTSYDGSGAVTIAVDTSVIATRTYVDTAIQGVDWKSSVRAATTTAGTLSTSFTNASVIDGVTLVTGDRILIKDQAAGAENGIYTVNASGAPTRATDADVASELTGGVAVFVEEGTTQADTGWVITINGTPTLGTTAITWAQFTSLGQITAGAGLTKTGNTLDVVGTANRITANADSIDIASTYVGQTSITTVGTIATGTWSGSFGAVSGANLTSLTAGNLSGTIPSAVLGNSTVYIGTTAVPLNRTTASLALTGITSIDGNAATVTNGVYTTGTYSNPTWITSLAWSKISTTPTTLSGYGITDAAPLASPALTGTPTAPTATAGTNTTQIATTAFVTAAVSSSGVKKYTATNASLTPSTGTVTWTIAASTHLLGATGAIIPALKEVASGAIVEPDFVINDTTGDVTVSWNASATVTAGTYRVILMA